MFNESNPKLSIIIVSYNTKDLLLQCLSSVFEQTVETDFEIIVVDNNSKDYSVREVNARFPKIKVIANAINLGYAKANNQALRLIKGEFALLLNPDTMVIDNALDKMVKFMQNNKNMGILGCCLLNANNKLQRAAFPPPSLWISITSKLNIERLSPGKADRYYRHHLERLFPPHLTNSYYDKEYNRAQKAFRAGWVSGACLLIRRATIEDAGLMDENLFLFGEDTDWCTRVRKRKWGIMLLPQARVVHLGGMSTSGALSLSIGASHFSRLYFAKKHFGPVSVFILRCLAFATLLVKHIIVRLNRRIPEAERRSRLEGYREGFKIIFSRIKLSA